MDSKIFISYSHKDEKYRDELVPALEAVAEIRDRVWLDQKGIDIGDQFHHRIQQALAESKLGILLVSNHFLTSRYIKTHELPLLLRQARDGALKLGLLYVSSVAEAALSVTIETDGRPHTVHLADIIGVNSPAEPLDLIEKPGERNVLYARTADWVSRKLTPTSTPIREFTGPRPALAILIQTRRDHWQHQFFLPTQPGAITPNINCPEPASVFGYDQDGDTLFELLFGSDPQTVRHLLALAFNPEHIPDPTYSPLRVRLLTDDERLRGLSWGNIAYQGRPLYREGWTVELHTPVEPGFPEYSRHTCYFPGRAILAGSEESSKAAHFQDLQRFFQQHWQDNPEPALAADPNALRSALQVGSPRLVYYYGPASREGLLLQDPVNDECLPWATLAEWLHQTRSVSALFLNLLGETGCEAFSQGPILLNGVKGAVLFQCNPRAQAHAAARAGQHWLDAVFCRRLDPVVALYQQPTGSICAWTRYSSWQTTAPPPKMQYAGLVNLLLDRHRQRDTLFGAKEEFYTFPRRFIHHVVALGTPGCLTYDFPEMIKQHLVSKKREQEAYFYRSIELTATVNTLQRVDDAVRRLFHLNPHQPLLEGMIDPEVTAGNTFCFLVLGWQLSQEPVDETLLHAVADWCRQRLGEELGTSEQQGKIRVLSILALESDKADEYAPSVEQLLDEYDTEPEFYFGELDPLTAVRRRDLLNYFRNETFCGCDDRYREPFPDLLLGERPAMPFEEAVSTIRRGEPDNWGTLFDELHEMTENGAWPPPHYDPDFWSKQDGR